MKVKLYLEGSKSEILEQVAEFVSALSAPVETPAEEAPKPARKPRAKKEEIVPEEEEEFDLDSDTEEEEELPGEAIDIDQVVKAFQDFAKEKPANRAKAKDILQKLKVKSVRELKEKDFQKALDMIEGA